MKCVRISPSRITQKRQCPSDGYNRGRRFRRQTPLPPPTANSAVGGRDHCAVHAALVASGVRHNPWVRPDSASEAVILYALSSINFLAFVLLLMVLVRNIIKLRQERRQMKLGAKFKTRLVVFHLALAAACDLLFFVTHSIINRSVRNGFVSRQTESWITRGGSETFTSAASSRNQGAWQSLWRSSSRRTPDGEIQSALAAQCDINGARPIARFYDSGGRIVAERSQGKFELFPEEFRAEWRKAQSDATRGSNYTPD